ncbi:hypothetical protein R3W88_028312 [Solanum pinnatisectum]|uniref:Uncharacterized protein n=1 Tax=Solanum pinnatisectum TaxID=50273 RepID=A0AAV9LJQ9_9SOLN|nr:hypothetical protein R3W88_028312 [Solanum pinnatisectum]
MFEESKKRLAESYTTLATDGVTGIVVNVKQLKDIDCHCYFCLDEVMEKCNALNDSIKIEAEKRTTKAKSSLSLTTVEVEIAGKTSVYLLAHELNLQRIGEISLVSGLVSTYVVMKEKLKGTKLKVASHWFDEMSERNHVQAVHICIRFQNKFSLVLVENELVVPVWDPGICSGDVLAFSLIVEKYDFSLEEPEAHKMNLVIEAALDLGVTREIKHSFPVWEHGFHKQTGSISWYIGAPVSFAPVPTSWLVDFGISSSANDNVVKLSKLMKNVRLTFDPGGNSIGLEYMIGCMILSHCVDKSKANLNVAFQLFIELNREEYMNQEEGTFRAAKVTRELRNAFGWAIGSKELVYN